MPEISIIIPVYNSEKYLPKCLEALANQTFKDIEIICINDGSKDKSLEILNQFAEQDSRFKVFTQKNSGPAAARNQGLQNASGKYLMFCDSDDWYEPNMCEIMYKTITEQNVDVVQCCAVVEREFDSSNRKNIEAYINAKETGKFQLQNSNFHLVNALLWNKIWKKSIIDKYNIYFPDVFNHEDDAFSYIYRFVCKDFFILDKYLYHYIVRNNSLMEVYKQNQYNKFSRIIISEFIGNFLITNKLLEKNKNLLLNIFKGQITVLSAIFSSKKIMPMVKRLEKYCRKKIDKNIKFLRSPSGKILIINQKEISSFLYVKYYVLSKITFGKMRKHYKKKRKELKSRIKQVKQFLKGK